MPEPASKVEIWQSGALLYTFQNEVIDLYYSEMVTDGIGSFRFSIPTKKDGATYYYNDIALNDTVKIWLDYAPISGSADFIGKISRISAPLSTQEGYIRQISGLSQGEVLMRRLKRETQWVALRASGTSSSAVNIIASDLGLGTSQIDSVTTTVDFEIEAEKYFDLLKRISDYWYDATTKIQKDFYVNVDNNLVWKARPLRSVGVESFTVGSNIIHYNVLREKDYIVNKIHTYGAVTKRLPATQDAWTDSTTGWTSVRGALTKNTDRKVGSYSVQCYATSDPNPPGAKAYYSFSSTKMGFGKSKYKRLNFWYWHDAGVPYAFLFCPDSSNYVQKNLFTFAPTLSEWHYVSFSFKRKEDFNLAVGLPDLDNVQAVCFETAFPSIPLTFRVDDIFFDSCNYYGLVEDGTVSPPTGSQGSYGIRELDYTDVKLPSDSDCTKRGNALLMQLKDPMIQLTITVPGNSNLLVGDRLSMTIPAENITTTNFDVVEVEHALTEAQGYLTKATMINTAVLRGQVPQNMTDFLVKGLRQVNQLNREERMV